MWTATPLTGGRLRAEVVGRLRILRERPWPGEIAAMIESIVDNHSKADGSHSPFMPGPLEGHLLPAALGDSRNLPEALLEHLRTRLQEKDVTIYAAELVNFASLFVMPSEFIQKACSDAFEFSPDSLDDRAIEVLASLAHLSCLTRDERLGGAVTQKSISLATQAHSPAVLERITAVILLACGSIADYRSRSQFAGQHLTELTHRAPTQAIGSSFLLTLEVAAKSMEVADLARAKAAAIMAA